LAAPQSPQQQQTTGALMAGSGTAPTPASMRTLLGPASSRPPSTFASPLKTAGALRRRSQVPSIQAP
jgi:hypothetical protein